MTSEQIQALKAAENITEQLPAALEAWEKSNQGSVTLGWIHAANPVAVESLLAERDADKALIAEQVKQIDELEDIRAASERLVRCKGRYHSEQNYRALAALFGVSAPDLPPLDSEARTLTIKLPSQTDFDDPLSAYEAIEKCRDALSESCAAAGITLVVGE